MQLTEEEKQMLNGDNGPEAKKAMDILVALGRSFKAKKLIEINSVHMAGSAIRVSGDAGAKFVKDSQKQGGTFKTTVTTNPTSIDPKKWDQLGISEKDHEDQQALTNAYKNMGANISNTCTPFIGGNTPRFGEHVAWGESSAVVYINSVIGARTNREGGPSGLASAITARTPEYGFHLKENRYGKVLVKIESELNDLTDYGTLGYFTGSIVGKETPVFTGMPENTTIEQKKALSAALATSGTVSMFHAVGVTPEASTLEEAFGGNEPEQTLVFNDEEKRKAENQLNTDNSSDVDWIQIGCPFATFDEIKELVDKLDGRKIHEDIAFWVTTSGQMYEMAKNSGHIETLEDAGVTIVTDTCPFMARTPEIAPKKGYEIFATNSAKMAFYTPGMLELKAHYGNIDKLVNAAIKGKWEGN